jgi:hypothetical protein
MTLTSAGSNTLRDTKEMPLKTRTLQQITDSPTVQLQTISHRTSPTAPQHLKPGP